jgi:hypothetical protein
VKYLIEIEGKVELKISISDTMLNHYSFQKFKLIEKSKFNYLINT